MRVPVLLVVSTLVFCTLLPGCGPQRGSATGNASNGGILGGPPAVTTVLHCALRTSLLDPSTSVLTITNTSTAALSNIRVDLQNNVSNQKKALGVPTLQPPFKIKAEFGEEELADFTTQYGWLRGHFFDSTTAAELRVKLYKRAQELALQRFHAGQGSAYRADIPQQVQRLLRQHFPGKRIMVRQGS